MSSTITLSAAQVRADLQSLGIDSGSMFVKAAPAVAPPVQQVKVEGDTGFVRAIVSVTGVEDEVNDVIMPGAYTETLVKRKPKVCWHHAWEKPIGRTTGIEEWLPGDRRLPAFTKDGKPWPKAAGALVAEMQFNLKSDRGREAFEAVRFYTESNECEWSIGYQVPAGKSMKDRQGRRLIKMLELYELSFVLFGAAPLSMTLDLKAAVDTWHAKTSGLRSGMEIKVGPGAGQAIEVEPDDEIDLEPVEGDDLVIDVKALHDAALPQIDWDMVRLAAREGKAVVDVAAIAVQPEHRFEIGRKMSQAAMLAAAKAGAALHDGSYAIESEHDLRAAMDHVQAKSITDETVRDHVARRAIELGRDDLLAKMLGGGMEAKRGGADRDRGNADALRRWYVHGEGAAKIRWGTDGDFMRCVRIAGKHMGERAKGYCQLRHIEATGQPAGRGAHGGKKSADLQVPVPVVAETKAAETMVGKGVMVALPLPEDLAKDLTVKGGNAPEDMHVTLAFLGDADDMDDDTAEALVSSVRAIAAYCPPLVGNVGGLGQFPDNGSGVPSWIPVDVPMLASVRERLIGLLGAAGVKVALNHGYTPHVTLGYDVDSPKPVPSTDVTFEHIDVVIGERRERIPLGAAFAGYDPALDKPVESKGINARAVGSFEERSALLAEAARDAFGVNDDDGATVNPGGLYVFVPATWEDHALVCVNRGNDEEFYDVPYSLTDSGVSLGEPEKVSVTATVTSAETPAGERVEEAAEDMLGRYAESLMDEVAATFAAHSKGLQESKAGRVLSGANTSRLQAAVQNLLTVLEAAGVVIIKPAPGDVEAEREQEEAHSGQFTPTPDTTSVPATRAVAGKDLRVSREDMKALAASMGVDVDL